VIGWIVAASSAVPETHNAAIVAPERGGGSYALLTCLTPR
jgi:hypothetical protein